MSADDPLPADLAHLLADLPEEIPPVRDLWETIEQEVGPKASPSTPSSSPPGMGIPFGVLAAVTLAIGASFGASQSLGGTRSAVTAWESQVRTATKRLVDQQAPTEGAAVEAEMNRAIDSVRGTLATKE